MLRVSRTGNTGVDSNYAATSKIYFEIRRHNSYALGVSERDGEGGDESLSVGDKRC